MGFTKTAQGSQKVGKLQRSGRSRTQGHSRRRRFCEGTMSTHKGNTYNRSHKNNESIFPTAIPVSCSTTILRKSFLYRSLPLSKSSFIKIFLYLSKSIFLYQNLSINLSSSIHLPLSKSLSILFHE